MPDLTTPSAVLTATLSAFVFVPDLPRPNGTADYRSFASEVRAGRMFKDNCVGFALTTTELLQAQGIEARTVIVTGPRLYDYRPHMVTRYRDPLTGAEMMLDNRYPAVRSWGQAIKGSMYRE